MSFMLMDKKIFQCCLLNETIEKMRKEGENMLKKIKEIKNFLDELDRIALKSRVFTNVEYFEQMIDFEKEKKIQDI